MVLNDDVIFHKNFEDEFFKLNIPDNFNVLRLGIKLSTKFTNNTTKNKIHKASKFNRGSFATIYKTEYVKNLLLKQLQEINFPYDRIYSFLTKSYDLIEPLVIYDTYEKSQRNKTLKESADQYGWNLDNFKILNSPRQIVVNITTNKDIDDILECFNKQTYTNFKVFIDDKNYEYKFITNTAIVSVFTLNCNKKVPSDYLQNYINNVVKNGYKNTILSKDQEDFKLFLMSNKITSINISKSLNRFYRIKEIFNLDNYSNEETTLFFGVYNNSDLDSISNHKGKKYVAFGGSDCDISTNNEALFNIKKLLAIKDIEYIAISHNIQLRLGKLEIKSLLIKLDLVNYNIFKKLAIYNGEKIYIYDGQDTICDKKKKVYNHEMINKVKEMLPQYEYIHSSKLNAPYNKMPEIYSECFIGLRLTSNDGNANTVMEFKALGIPIVHNNSEYGLKWKNVDDIVNLIKNTNTKNILIFTHINLSHTAGDTIMVSNYVNKYINYNNNVTLISRYNIENIFLRNIKNKNKLKTKTIKTTKEIIKYIDDTSRTIDLILIRDQIILKSIQNKEWLNKTIIYGLDVHLEGIKNLDNKYSKIYTQSEKLKKLFIDNKIDENKIEIVEPIAYKYKFNLSERNDNEIRLIYCGTLRDEENTLEIIEEFQKIHKERPEVVLKIVYGKIHGNQEFTKKINEYIKNGVKGITFKHNLSHRDACYEIATSDIGICWRKKGWGDNGEVSTKVMEYELYGLFFFKKMKDLKIYNLNNILNKEIKSSNIIIKNTNIDEKKCILIESYSNKNYISPLYIKIDNITLSESNLLLNKKYITPNYIDSNLYKRYKFFSISGDNLISCIIKNIDPNIIKIDKNYKITEETNETNEIYKNKIIYNNKIAYIGDEFTYNSLKDIINIEYISQNNIDNILPTDYDFLLCESTWHGIDGSWKYAFNFYPDKKWSMGLRTIITKFKKNNIKCIYYNKEDPTNFERFYNSAELFDIIITTSDKCVNKYKKIYPNTNIIALPFLCNPIKHNPLNNKKENVAYFIGGFYNHLNNRTKTTYKLFQTLLGNKYNFKIINRHYFFPKITRQLKRFSQHKNKYEIDKNFKKYECLPVLHNEAIHLYKKTLFQLNINTVTDCKTMSSRRLIELLACGCNVYSNESQSIDYLKLPVITNLNTNKTCLYSKYNLEGFYLTHIKFSYIYFIKKLLKLSNITIRSNVKIKISCINKNNFPEEYKSLLNIDNYNFELILKENKYINKEFIEKLLIYPYFFDGNICFTNNENDFFTIKNNLSIDKCIIKTKFDKTLLIPYTNMLYENSFKFKKYYDSISINKELDKDSILVVMCLWKRIKYLNNTLQYLENQNINKTITLCLWNNNLDNKDKINEMVNELKGKKVKIIIHHSLENIGGIGRFIFTKYICEQKIHFQNVIFIDDDQTFEEDCIGILLNNVKEKESYNWSGKKFYKDKGYWNCWSNIWPKLRNDIDMTNFDENYLNYGGTGFMIINTECFLMDEFYQFNEKFKFIEDLWMSYFIINKLGYKLQNGRELKGKVKIIQGENISSIAQVNLLKPLKDEFLNLLRDEGNWDV